MSELCIDAGVVVKLVLKGESHRVRTRRLLRDCIVNNAALVSPPLFESETDIAKQSLLYEEMDYELSPP